MVKEGPAAAGWNSDTLSDSDSFCTEVSTKNQDNRGSTTDARSSVNFAAPMLAQPSANDEETTKKHNTGSQVTCYQTD